jgi:integrase
MLKKSALLNFIERLNAYKLVYQQPFLMLYPDWFTEVSINLENEMHENLLIANIQKESYLSRYKKQTKLLKEGQTLYSFRHSGAIEIFKRTGSITKLQKAMGHSSINVSLTYLRGLEIAELMEEDMPMV